jgi:hypothetical protein
MFIKAIAAGAALLFFTASVADAAVFDVTASLKGATATAAAGSGSLSGELDTNTKALSYEIDYSGLTGPVMAAHMQGTATPVPNNQPIITSQSLTSPIEGTTTLTDAQVGALEAGKWSVDLGTAAHPNGEIAGQVQATRREQQDTIPLN